MTLLREFGLVVENGSVRPAEKTIDEMHMEEIPHLHAAVLILRRNTRTGVILALSQRRSVDKKQFPGHWCFSVSGHCIDQDLLESSPELADLKAMERESREEIGMKIDHRQLANTESIQILDSRGNVCETEKIVLPRLKNSLNVTVDDDRGIRRESPIISVAYLELLSDQNPEFDLQTEEIADLAWLDLEKLKKEKITPWLRHYLAYLEKIK